MDTTGKLYTFKKEDNVKIFRACNICDQQCISSNIPLYTDTDTDTDNIFIVSSGVYKCKIHI